MEHRQPLLHSHRRQHHPRLHHPLRHLRGLAKCGPSSVLSLQSRSARATSAGAKPLVTLWPRTKWSAKWKPTRRQCRSTLRWAGSSWRSSRLMGRLCSPERSSCGSRLAEEEVALPQLQPAGRLHLHPRLQQPHHPRRLRRRDQYQPRRLPRHQCPQDPWCPYQCPASRCPDLLPRLPPPAHKQPPWSGHGRSRG